MVDVVVAGRDPLNTRYWRGNADKLLGGLSDDDYVPRALRMVELPNFTHSWNTHYPQFYMSVIGKLLVTHMNGAQWL